MGERTSDECMLRIGEMAAFCNVSVKSLRIYELKNIIKPAYIDPETGYRYYEPDQVHQLNALIELKTLGFSLNEIKEIMCGKLDSEGITKLLGRKRVAWEEAIAVAENKIEAIDSITKRFEGPQASAIQELTDEQRAWLLVKMVCVEEVRSQKILSEALWL